MTVVKLPSIHPREILKEEFMAPLNLSVDALASGLHVDANRVGQIVNGERSITGDMAIQLADFFGTTAEFWLNLQSLYDFG